MQKNQLKITNEGFLENECLSDDYGEQYGIEYGSEEGEDIYDDEELSQEEEEVDQFANSTQESYDIGNSLLSTNSQVLIDPDYMREVSEFQKFFEDKMEMVFKYTYTNHPRVHDGTIFKVSTKRQNRK